MIVIMGVLMILGGIAMLDTPLLNYIGAGYSIILFFFISGIFGIIRGFVEKKYNKQFFFSILSLILGLAGFIVPGAAAMNNSVLLYLAAAWFLIHGVLSIASAVLKGEEEQKGIGRALSIVFGVLELVMGIYSIAHPTVLAVGLGLLIAFYYIEAGVNMILVGTAICKGSNSLTILFTFMGILTLIGGIAMLATPLVTFLGAGYCIVMLFFVNGLSGIARAFAEKRYDKEFFFSILSLILGVIGIVVPGIAELNDSVLLYLAAGWCIIRGVLSIITALRLKKEGAGFIATLIGILLGVLDVGIGIYSIAHPAVLAISLGILIGLYFIESGLNMLFLGSNLAKIVALSRQQ